MLARIRSLFSRADGAASLVPVQDAAPQEIHVEGLATFPFVDHLSRREGLPVPDWQAVERWLAGTRDPGLWHSGWNACERAWLLHMRDALGEGHALWHEGQVMLLSSSDPRQARATLAFMERTFQRVRRTVGALAAPDDAGNDILILFDDEEDYYRYLSLYYEEDGEFTASSGCHINAGCGHFVSTRDDLNGLEPVIVHEMTHSCLSHLPIPLWLNEGIAVSTERHLAGGEPDVYAARELREKHLSFWGEREIQQFWSGEAFELPGIASELAYDLATILVRQMSQDWNAFEVFAQHASDRDGGAEAAREHLGIELGAAVCAFLERDRDSAWQPRPVLWSGRVRG